MWLVDVLRPVSILWTPIAVLLAYGAAARLTRLVTTDTIAAPLRAALIRRYGANSAPDLFIRCPWCVGLWIAVVPALLVWAAGGVPSLWAVPLLALTINYVYARFDGGGPP